MNTPSHLLVNLALFGWARTRARNWAVAIGALLPDAPIALMFVWERWVRGTPFQVIVGERYFSQPWQNIIDTFNSVPFMLVGLLACCVLHRSAVAVSHSRVQPSLKLRLAGLPLLFISMLAHVALDVPVHTADAHRHLFPFSDYRFRSAFSYWDMREYAYFTELAELMLVLGSVFVLWRRSGSRMVHAVLAGAGIAYLTIYTVVFLPYLVGP